MMVSNKEQYTITKPTVAGNRYRGHQGTGVIHVLPDDPMDVEPMGIIEIHQYEKWEEQGKVKKNTRRGYIRGTVENLIEIGWEPGVVTGGRCYIEETYEPPDEDDPEAFLAWEDGRVKRVGGRAVYRIEAFSFSAHQPDIIIESQEHSQQDETQ